MGWGDGGGWGDWDGGRGGGGVQAYGQLAVGDGEGATWALRIVAAGAAVYMGIEVRRCRLGGLAWRGLAWRRDTPVAGAAVYIGIEVGRWRLLL